MSAKASTDGVPSVPTGGDNTSDSVGQTTGSTENALINKFDYAGGMKDFLTSIKTMTESANQFLPSFAPESPILLARADGINPNSTSDALPVFAQLTGEKRGEKRNERRAEPTRQGDINVKPEAVDPGIQAKIDDLQQRFKITITPPGIKLGNQENLCAPERARPGANPTDTGAPIHSRVPTMRELKALESALQSTGDAALTRDGSPLKVTFTDKPSESTGRKGKSGGEGAYYLPPKENNGVAELRINPTSKLFEPILTHMLRHEIGHNAENNAYTDSKHPDDILHGIGFKPVPNPFYSGAPGEPSTIDAVRVNENGKESLYIRLPPDCYNPRGDWLRVNEKGQLISQFGRVVPMRNGEPDFRSPIQPFSRPDSFIQNNIVVKNPTKYFDNANEVITEAFARYSGLDDAGKAKFQLDFPNHYEAVRRMLEAQKRNLGR
ncbi:MAG: hypothetical protein SFY67_03505 [Candidatus Melainabacteria bacterium]|nr:hypothetical protein [Candidatus Melainabacteria bacterium]